MAAALVASRHPGCIHALVIDCGGPHFVNRRG
jgi:hypothetical protein